MNRQELEQSLMLLSLFTASPIHDIKDLQKFPNTNTTVAMKNINNLIIGYFDNQLTYEEVDFLLMSEEKRINKYGLHYAYDLYVSCKEKLERQKDIMDEKRY